MARPITTWAHASARRRRETWVRSIKILRFLAVLGGTGIPPKGAWHVPGVPLGVEFGSLAAFFSKHPLKKPWPSMRLCPAAATL